MASSAKDVQTLVVEEVVKYPAESIWQAYMHEFHSSVPQAMPGHFDTCQHVEGEAIAVGSVFTVTYHPDVEHYEFIKLRWDVVDHKNYRFKCSLIDGGALNKHFSHLAYNFSILPGPKPNTSVMHYTVEYVDLGDHSFHDFIVKELKGFISGIESYLNKKA